MIARIIKESSIDYPGKYGPLIFTAGCNFKCGFCHNAQLNDVSEFLNEDEIIKEIETKVKGGWYTGITISGGEPTLHPGLENFIIKLKNLGLNVKLDSNGTNPSVLRKLIDGKLVDYIAMDIKGPRELYLDITNSNVDIKKIEESIRILSSLPEEKYEFRTTTPFLFKPYPRLINEKEFEQMAKWVKSIVGDKKSKWFVQGFISRNKEDMNDLRLSVEKLPKELHKTPENYLDNLKNVTEKFGFKVEIR